jgi:hypothetical protein
VLSPEPFSVRIALLSKPDNVVPIRMSVWQIEFLSLSDRLIVREHLLQEHGNGPSVQKDMMIRPDKLMEVLATTDKPKSEERHIGWDEATSPFFPEKKVQSPMLVRRRHLTPVIVLDSRRDIPVDNLKRLLQTFAPKGRPQNLVLIYDSLPSLTECFMMQFPSKRATQLLDIYL